MMNKLIDAKGKECPIPVIMAKKEIDKGNKNFVIEVDNKIAVQNLQKLANSQSLSINIQEENNIFKVTFFNEINKDNECIECNEILNKLQGNKNRIGDWCVFLGKEIIGAGNEELGKSLVKMFFYTISEDENLPKAILFMNDGVKVPTLNEQAVEHLKDLEEKGVQILTCGACLNFYKLEDNLKVGKVSNMYDITSIMKESAKVITL